MEEPAIEDAAKLISEARRTVRVLPGLPAQWLPGTLEEAYRIQDRVFGLSGEDCAGWFVGCSNPAIQRQLGLPGPYRARLMASSVHESPADLTGAGFPSITLELEFAFRLGRDLPPRSEPYEPEEVAAAVASLHPAIEVVASHFEDWTHQPVLVLIVDNGTDGALVYGRGREDWRALDPAAVTVALEVNGDVVRRGSGAEVEGGPLAVMTWLANNCRAAGLGLRAGQINNTGSCAAMYHAAPGERAVARFAGLGEVAVQL